MTLIETKTLGADAASIEFTSIPQDGTDLLVTVSGRCDRNVFDFSYVYLQFNSSATGYTDRNLIGGGTSGASSTSTLTTAAITCGGVSQANNTSNTFGNTAIYIPNYTGSTNKSVSVDGVNETNGGVAVAQITAGLWSNTAAITSIELKPWQSGTLFNWVAGTTISLYKITKGSDGIVTTS
jgi:hypothetical protein